MPSFSYIALDSSGNKISGDLNCRNKSEAYRELESKALSPVSVESMVDVSAGAKKKSGSLPSKPVPLARTALITLTEELSDLLDAGLQLEQALRILHDRQQNKGIKSVAGILREEIREGTRFSQALKRPRRLSMNFTGIWSRRGKRADLSPIF